MPGHTDHTHKLKVVSREPQGVFTFVPGSQIRREDTMTFAGVSPKKLIVFLSVVVLGLTLAHVATQVGKHLLHHERQLGLVRLFDLDQENNIPSWYSSSTLLLCAGLLTVIGLAKKQVGDFDARGWLGLAIIFVYLSVDEAASIHEMAILPLRSFFKTTGLLTYAWIIPGAILVLILSLMYLRFLLGLPVKTRVLFLVAATLYIGGALGVESLGGRYDYLYGDQHLTYAMLVAWEESFEMLGILVFLYALSSYISLYASGWRVLSVTVPNTTAGQS